MKNNKAFTLIEIMVAIAIVAILAAVVLVSMKSYGAKGRSTKALAQLSSAIPSMISCWGNAGTVTVPPNNPSRDICSLAASYGQWPQIAGDLSSYVYTGSSIDNTNKKFVIKFTSSGSGGDDKRICCNSTMNSCKVLDTAATACDASS